MKTTFLQESLYLLKSKISRIVLVIICLLVAFAGFQAVNTQGDSWQTFKITRGMYQSSAEFNQDIQKPYQIQQQSNRFGQVSTTVDNSARYNYENVIHSQNQLHSIEFTRFLFGSLGLVLFPLLTGILGISIATHNFASATYKRKLDNHTWLAVFSGKVLTLFAATAAIYVLAAVLASLLGLILPHLVKLRDLSEYGIYLQALNAGDMILTVLVACLIGVVTALIWFSVGLICKRSSIAIVIFLIYQAVIPNLGRTDFKNAIMSLFSRFTNQLVLQPWPYRSISLPLSLGLTAEYVFGALILGYFIFSKKHINSLS
ncbi:MAG: hypothetical protein ABF899_01895 [Oenococcus sp.]|uniref:hypothetical protein n=1 Tax=Oenococcus sp. TaxID=1979414 RepID=UPI0039ED7881